ncbi:hypothetical protein SAMN04487766_10848 [Actinomyces ruminicola]|uniref:Uncharacterized protein n=1 Tax=Actinomyces ruminicola TaxID=332524 RepID=A0A1G9WV39_9ACTO|nr:hypothetical protein SAMN04487766_10848 [Actinomyces ruminicola]
MNGTTVAAATTTCMHKSTTQRGRTRSEIRHECIQAGTRLTRQTFTLPLRS